MRNLEIRKNVQVNFTPEQWELYTESMDCSPAVEVLNQLLENLVNEGVHDKKTVMEKMLQAMSAYSNYGAYDSEPIYFLESVVRKIYD